MDENEKKQEYTTCGKCGRKLDRPSTSSWRRCYDCKRADRREEFKEVTRWEPDRIVQLLPASGFIVFAKAWHKWLDEKPTEQLVSRDEYFDLSPSPVLAWALTAQGDIEPVGFEDWPPIATPLRSDYLVIRESEIAGEKDAIWKWASDV